MRLFCGKCGIAFLLKWQCRLRGKGVCGPLAKVERASGMYGAAVHVHGTAKLEDDVFLRKTIEDTTAKYESKMPSPWKMPIPEDYIASMMKAIVGFSIRITRVEGKFKLGQNRSLEDRLGAISHLEQSGSADGAALAAFMRAQGAGSS